MLPDQNGSKSAKLTKNVIINYLLGHEIYMIRDLNTILVEFTRQQYYCLSYLPFYIKKFVSN